MCDERKARARKQALKQEGYIEATDQMQRATARIFDAIERDRKNAAKKRSS